jgi:hypothetical protein
MAFTLLGTSCQKRNEFLDKKPRSDLSIPATLSDLQQLLDDNNNGPMNKTPELGEVSADDYYVIESAYNTLPIQERNAYVWDSDIFSGQGMVSDYNIPYQQVLVCNIVLEQLSKIPITDENKTKWENIKGTALFCRAFAFYNLSQLYAPVYDSNTASTDPGIPIRLTSDINAQSIRSNVEQTYNQIVSDLVASENLVQEGIDNYRNRPSKPAVYAMLSRVYLSMKRYNKAYAYADSSLNIYDELIDYNTIDTNSQFPFSNLNAETLYSTKSITANATSRLGRNEGYSIDTMLYSYYQENDLRKKIYYQMKGISINLKGNYYGSSTSTRFTGLATDELYLTRAECSIRNGDITKGLDDLNSLLRKRFLTGTFGDIETTNKEEALSMILKERRKELVMRNTRWTDLRRLNQDGFNIVIRRQLAGQTYVLQPNDPKYILPFPNDVIALSGIVQNQR